MGSIKLTEVTLLQLIWENQLRRTASGVIDKYVIKEI